MKLLVFILFLQLYIGPGHCDSSNSYDHEDGGPYSDDDSQCEESCEMRMSLQ